MKPDHLLEAKAGLLQRNAVRCLGCDTVVESMHRHDFRTCECGNVSVDGGLLYARVVFATDAKWERVR